MTDSYCDFNFYIPTFIIVTRRRLDRPVFCGAVQQIVVVSDRARCVQVGLHHATAEEARSKQRRPTVIPTNIQLVGTVETTRATRLPAAVRLPPQGGSSTTSAIRVRYRVHHSTETAVLKVLSDILLAVDNGDLSVLALLDLSAALDTVDHDILLTRLRVSYGVGGPVLEWFRSWTPR